MKCQICNKEYNSFKGLGSHLRQSHSDVITIPDYYNKSELIKLGYDKNKSEYEIMKVRGYVRIYGPGEVDFEYVK